MYFALKALYNNPMSRVVLNNTTTDYFSCPTGVMQGSPDSPTLFAIFVDSLTRELRESGKGVTLETTLDNPDNPQSPRVTTTTISSLLYADDIVVISETEEDLQLLLNIVNQWCLKWRLSVNLLKTNVMHVRNTRTKLSNFVFKLGEGVIKYCDSYKYLGVSINQFLNFNTIAEQM